MQQGATGDPGPQLERAGGDLGFGMVGRLRKFFELDAPVMAPL